MPDELKKEHVVLNEQSLKQVDNFYLNAESVKQDILLPATNDQCR